MIGSTPMNIHNGMRIVESPLATESRPVREHRLTRSQLKHLEKHMFKGITYHDRIQKKWNKRFGFKQVPGCFIVDTSKLTFGDLNGGEKVILMHPVVAKAFKEHDGKQVPEKSMRVEYDELKKRSQQLHDHVELWSARHMHVLNPNGVINMDGAC